MADNPITLERIAELREGMAKVEARKKGWPIFHPNDIARLLDLAEIALKQPRTQWQPRITREQIARMFIRPVFLDMGYKGLPNDSDIDRMIFRLRELGIDVTEPPEASRG